MIGNVTVLNLPHRTDRKYYMIGHLETIGTPLHLIKFFPAKYGQDYDSIEQIRSEMIDDGFGVVSDRNLLADRPEGWCYIWNWLHILRDFSERNFPSLLILDDRMLKLEWDTLTDCVNFLYRTYPPFKVLQLGWTPLWKGGRTRIEPLSGFVARGFRANGDYATVLSPEGAKWLLDRISVDGKSPEPLFFEMSQGGGPIDGCFHMIENQVDPVRVDWGGDIF